MPNQWPTFDERPKVQSVRSVLLEEGSGIAERTYDKIRFVVESEPQGKGGFTHHCYLFVPAIGYRYPLMRVMQESLDYPVTIIADAWPKGTSAGDEGEFRKDLGLVFRSDPVKRVVPQLLEMVA